MIVGRLGYNYENNRYGLLVNDLWENTGFHCGDSLEVIVDDKWIASSIEMLWTNTGSEWYLPDTPYRGNLEYVRARV